MRSWYVVLILSWFVSATALASPSIDVDYRFYDISPKDKYAIAGELIEQSPILIDGQRFLGATSWEVEWHYQWKEYPDRCQLLNSQVDFKATVTMPRLDQKQQTPYPLDVTSTFNHYYQALLEHENDHVYSGIMAAIEIKQTMLSQKHFPSCDELNKTINRTGHSIVQKYNQRDKHIDHLTKHGRTAGVNLDKYVNAS